MTELTSFASCMARATFVLSLNSEQPRKQQSDNCAEVPTANKPKPLRMSLRHALRSLKRTPVFTITVLLTLVLGIGSVGSMFAIVYGVLLAPLPYGEPERLVSVALHAGSGNRMQQPPAVYFTYRQFAQRLSGVGFYRTGSTNVWTQSDGAQSVIATWVTASMMPLLQIPPLLGRAFSADEEVRGGPNAVILSESEWRTRFNAAPDVIGKALIVNSAPREIVGVMPARCLVNCSNSKGSRINDLLQ